MISNLRLETNNLIPIRHSHVSPWKEIYGLNKDLLKVNINLDLIFLKKIGDGSVFKFWHDCWFGTSNFMSLFPRMYALETHKDCLISESCFSGGLMDLSSHVWAWRRSPRDGIEKAQFDDLVNLLLGFKPTDVKWNKTLPIKINIHSWRLSKDRLPTRSNLDARGIDIDSLRCPVCNDAIESTPHLFVECTIASDIWSRIKDWWGLVCTLNNLDGILSWHETAHLNTKEKLCLDVVVNTSTGSFNAIEIEFALT
ncbi:reverse transcriptase domain, Reverse transcriptase zinc-binding domain protein [Artemisia annua]|uniref:Reverse transcriptase domain, Reverse transcriptase zinc-binding domain protein n=1 Tax=Artemisia annua TaxID=35608 RepID=A0A2U1PJH2_ARTAN|nr:reverse transcriptase domain, Reverse transcriptase zinc-binding domain protein [Artemisia annua]